MKKLDRKKIITLILVTVCCISFLLGDLKKTKASTWDNAEEFASSYPNRITYNPDDNYIYYGASAILAAENRIKYRSLGHVITIYGTEMNVQVKIGDSEYLVDKKDNGVGTTEYLLYKISYQDLIQLFSKKYGINNDEIQKLYTAPTTNFVVDTIITIVNPDGSLQSDIFENGSGNVDCTDRANVAFTANEIYDLWIWGGIDFDNYYKLQIRITNKKFISAAPMQISTSDNNASPIYQSNDHYYVRQGKNFKLLYNAYSTSSYSPPNRAYFKIKNELSKEPVISNTYLNIENGQDSSSDILQDSNQSSYAAIVKGYAQRSDESKTLHSEIDYHMDADGMGLKFYPYATIQYQNRSLANSVDWDDSKAVYVIADGKAPDITNIDSSYGWTNQNVTLNPTVTDYGSGVRSKDFYNANNNTWLGNSSVTLSGEGIANIKVKASDNVGNESEFHSIVKIDKSAPDIIINGNTNNGDNYFVTWNKDDYQLFIESKDIYSGVKSFFVTEPNGTVINSTGNTISINVTNEGINTYVATSIDNTGNMRTRNITVEMDKTAPEITLNGMINQDISVGWTNQNVTVNASIQDDLSGIGQIDVKDENDNMVYSQNFSSEAEFIKSLRESYIARIYQYCYNRNPNDHERKVWYDCYIKENPSSSGDIIWTILNNDNYLSHISNEEFLTMLYRVTLDRPPEEYGYNTWLGFMQNGATRNEVTVSFITSLEYGIISGKYGVPTHLDYQNTNKIDFNFYASSDGVSKYHVVAEDNAGNTRIQIVTTKINKQGLKVSIPNYGWTNQDVKVVYDASTTHGYITNLSITNADASRTFFNYDGNYRSPVQAYFTVQALPQNEGITRWRLSAKDDSGNQAEMTNHVKIDITPPVISGVEEEYLWTRQGSITAKINDNDNWSPQSGVSRTELYCGSELLLTTKSDTLNYSFHEEGVNVYTIKAFDVAGNETEKNFKVTISYDASYTVNHYLMNTDGTGYTLEKTDDFTDEIGTSVTPKVLDFEGFSSPNEQSIVITADGRAVVDYYYTRNKYTIRFHANGGEGTMPDIVNYNQQIQLPTNTYNRKNEGGDSMFLGWNTDSKSHDILYLDSAEIGDLGLQDNSVVDLFAIWDDYPIITAQDRYYSLDDAKEGRITEENLLSSVSVTDDWDTEFQDTLKVTYYSPDEWKQFTSEASSVIQYEVTDSVGHIFYTKATVYIVDTSPEIDEKTKYVRFISPEFYQKTFEEGGLEDISIWKTDSTYAAVLNSAMENRRSLVEAQGSIDVWGVNYQYRKPGSIGRDHLYESWTFTKQKIEEIQNYIMEHGIGNLKEENSLQNFINEYM